MSKFKKVGDLMSLGCMGEVGDWLESNTQVKFVTPEIEKKLEFLECLEAAGVDNWEGHGEAHRMMRED